MKVRIGNFIYHHRNAMFPVFYILLFLKGPLLFGDYRLAAVAGILVAGLGQIVRGVTVGLEYIKRGGKNRMPYADDLVKGGIFAHCRNPLYVGNFTILVGTGIASNSLLFATIGLPFFVVAYAFIIAAEENYLRVKFGAEFDDYCATVNRLVPRLEGLGKTMGSMSFNWRRLVSAEYNSAFLWIVACCASVLQNAWLAGSYSLGDPLVAGVWCALAVALVGYGVARVLKKSGKLRPPVFRTSSD